MLKDQVTSGARDQNTFERTLRRPAIAGSKNLLAEKTRHYALDGVRGLSALAVANFHFIYFAVGVDVQSMGTFTVYIFFSLSALTMMMVYGRTFTNSILEADVLAFYRARAARILPLLATVSLANLILVRSKEAAARAFLTGSGAFALGPPGYLSIGNGAWSLGIELAFYAIFPLLALIIGRVSKRGLFAITVVAVVAQQAHLFLIADYPQDRHWQLYISALTFSPFFLIGFAVYRSGDWKRRAMLLPSFLLIIAVAAFSMVFPERLYNHPMLFMALTALVAVLLFCAWHSELPIFLRPGAKFLGEISYSLYLTHWFYFIAAQAISRKMGLTLWQFWALFIFSALVGAWLCYTLFERPARTRLGARRPTGS